MGVLPVHVEQVNLIDVKSFQTISTGRFDVLGITTDIEFAIKSIGEFSTQENLISTTRFLEPFSNHFYPTISTVPRTQISKAASQSTSKPPSPGSMKKKEQ